MHKIAEGYDFRNDIFFIRRPRHNNERDAVYSNFPPAGKSWLRNVQPYNLSNVITYRPMPAAATMGWMKITTTYVCSISDTEQQQGFQHKQLETGERSEDRNQVV